ncbi:MAG TPA: FliA/WhiG family RNA polymerase sigma factor [Bryobacteraceae bacterium]|nr:FliA/WhiG family RNA polymerase sigma factor [Bryobacteraceae bacterium]
MPTPSTSQTMSASERERLILENMPQVKLIARRIHDRLPSSISLDDLISTGVVGLISAIDRYDSTQGVKLKTYAEYKIRGAILDSLRQLDWAPRQQRKRARLIESAVSQLEQNLRREPTEDELSEFLGIATEEYREWVSEAHSLTVGSLDMAWDEPGSEVVNHVSDNEQHWPSRLLEKAELHRLLVRGVERLPNPERTVLSLYYLEELTLREIATVMEIHESRVSQLKSQGVTRLRAYLDRCWPSRGQSNEADKKVQGKG